MRPRTKYRFLSAALDRLETRDLPAALSFQFSLNDPTHQFSSYPLLMTDLQIAGQILASDLVGQGVINVQVNPDNSVGFADGGPEYNYSEGTTVLSPDSLLEARSGTDPNNGTGPEQEINLDIPNFLAVGYFDTSAARTGAIPSNEPDVVSVLIHEMIHGLGMSGLRSNDSSTLGQLNQGVESTFDADESAGTGAYAGDYVFTGPAAEAVFGGPVPMTFTSNQSSSVYTENFYHFGNPAGQIGNQAFLTSDLMSGLGITDGERYWPSALDLAVLKDVGWTLSNNHVVAGDFNGAGKTDLAVFRPSTDQWIVTYPTGGQTVTQFGDPTKGDLPAPGDYTGSGKTELALFRPSTDQWIIQLPSGKTEVFQFGDPTKGDVPVPGDYDGDGKTDLAVFRPSTDQWIIQLSTGGVKIVQFGDPTKGDIPIPGDYEGAGKTELAVFRPSTDQWILQLSTGVVVEQFGDSTHGDIPVPGDYDGDGKTDLAVFRPGTDLWIILKSGGGSLVTKFGDPTNGDVPALAPLGSLGLVKPTAVKATSQAGVTMSPGLMVALDKVRSLVLFDRRFG